MLSGMTILTSSNLRYEFTGTPLNKELREYVQDYRKCTFLHPAIQVRILGRPWMVVGICDVPEIVHLQEKRAASGKVEPENTTTETVPEDGQMKRPDDPPEPTKDLWWPWLIKIAFRF